MTTSLLTSRARLPAHSLSLWIAIRLAACSSPQPAAHDELGLEAAAQDVSLRWVDPPEAPVSGKVTLTLLGAGLVNVEIFHERKRVVRANVARDGKSATAELDTREFADGSLVLSAHGWNSPPDSDFSDDADAGPITLVVDNEAGEPAKPPPTSSTQDYHPDGFTLAFSDEFDGDELDRTQWCTRYIYNGGPEPQVPDDECQKGDGTLDFLNDEQERYVDTNSQGKKMHELRDGVLTLWATKTRDDEYAKYESAMLRSKKLFRPDASTEYYLTARLKLPSVKGSWPAFWLNADRKPDGSTTWPPEIDIIDAALNDQDDTADMLHQAAIVHGKQTDSGHSEYSFVAPEFDTQWSNYHAASSQRDKWIEVAIRWSEDSVCYFVDGYNTVCESYRWVEDDGTQAPPAHVLLNLAIGGGWAGRYGIDDASFPIRLEADYVRVYKR